MKLGRKNVMQLMVVLYLVLSSCLVWATPTREEVYRSDKLGLVVYKDGNDPEVFWYVPPVQLMEEKGKLTYYKRTKGDKIEYYFYIIPNMSDALRKFLAGEIVGLKNSTQLKPVRVRRFGIRVKQFETLALGDEITDYHYLNRPQLIKVPIAKANEDEFEFFLKNEPGIQALVLLYYDSERMDKYLTIQLSHKEIFNAMDIGVTGQYKFTKAEITNKVSSYVSQKYYTIRSKGAIKIPDVVNKVIEECFAPMKNKTTDPKKKKPWWGDDGGDDYILNPNVDLTRVETEYALQTDLERGVALPKASYALVDVMGDDDEDPKKGGDDDGDWSTGGSGSGGSARTEKKLVFEFKKELATSEKVFFYKEEQFSDSSEIAALPVYINVNKPNKARDPEVTERHTKNELVVTYKSENDRPYKTGIQVKDRDQFTMQAVFNYFAESKYSSYELRAYRWKKTWPDNSGDLYYRIGDDGPWIPMTGGRVVIKAEEIRNGEIQFHVDRQAIWDKIPSDYKDGKVFGLVKPVFTYQRTYPQYDIVITGKHFEYALPRGYLKPDELKNLIR